LIVVFLKEARSEPRAQKLHFLTLFNISSFTAYYSIVVLYSMNNKTRAKNIFALKSMFYVLFKN